MLEVMRKYNCTKENCAYIGDDILDIPCMKQCAIAACPADVMKEVKDICQYACKSNAGKGAVREFIETILLKS